MKKLILSLLILISFAASAQTYKYLTLTGETGYVRGAMRVDGLTFYTFNDTLPVPVFAQNWWTFARLGDSLYWYSPVTKHYKVLGGAGGGGALTWGSITGLLSNQTDLQAALNLKQNKLLQGTTAQYFRGDLSLGTFSTDVLSAVGSRVLPPGGSTGQVLTKTSGTDYAVSWQPNPDKYLVSGSIVGARYKTIYGTYNDGTSMTIGSFQDLMDTSETRAIDTMYKSGTSLVYKLAGNTYTLTNVFNDDLGVYVLGPLQGSAGANVNIRDTMFIDPVRVARWDSAANAVENIALVEQDPVALNKTITINGVSHDLADNPTFTIDLSVYATNARVNDSLLAHRNLINTKASQSALNDTAAAIRADFPILPFANNTNNYVVTATGTGLNGESGLQYNGTTLDLASSAIPNATANILAITNANGPVSEIRSHGTQTWHLYDIGVDTLAGTAAIALPGGHPGIVFYNATGTGRSEVRQYQTGGGLAFNAQTGGAPPLGQQMVLKTDGELSIEDKNANPLTATDAGDYRLQVHGNGYVRDTLYAGVIMTPGGTVGSGGATYTFSSEFTNASNAISINAIAQSKITGLTAALGSYYPIAGGTLTGTAGAGYLGLPNQSATPSTPAAGSMKIYSDSIGRFSWKTSLGYSRTFRSTVLTGNRVYGLQDKDYTFADSATLAALAATVTSNTTAIAGKQDKLLTISTSTTNYTLALSDAGVWVRQNVSTANTVTIPPNSSVAFPVGTQVTVENTGAGQVTFTPGSGVTLNSAGNARKLRVQYSVATLIKTAADVWSISGDIQ